MLKLPAAAKALLAIAVAIPTLVSADDARPLSVSGVGLSTTGLLMSDLSAVKTPQPEQLVVKSIAYATNSVTEEIVVTANRIGRRTEAIDPSLERVFREMERTVILREELEWLKPFTRSGETVTLGYDPEFEFRNRSLAYDGGSGLMEQRATPVLRLQF